MAMTHDEWLAARRNHMTGTDIATILGFSKWRTPLDVWLDKRGEAEAFEENESMRWGKLLERPVAERYAELEGVLLKPGEFTVHPTNNLFAGTPDFRIAMQRRGLEVKTTDKAMAKDWEDGVPLYYVAQPALYMAIDDVPEWDVAALIGGNRYKQFRLYRDAELETMMMEQCAEWWQVHIVQGKRPDLDGSDSAKNYIERRFARNTAPVRPATEAECVWAHVYAQAEREKKAAEVRMQEARVHLCDSIGEADGIAGAGFKVTWKATKDTTKVDNAALAAYLLESMEPAARPAIIEKFTTVAVGSRRFLPKFDNEKE